MADKSDSGAGWRLADLIRRPSGWLAALVVLQSSWAIAAGQLSKLGENKDGNPQLEVPWFDGWAPVPIARLYVGVALAILAGWVAVGAARRYLSVVTAWALYAAMVVTVLVNTIIWPLTYLVSRILVWWFCPPPLAGDAREKRVKELEEVQQKELAAPGRWKGEELNALARQRAEERVRREENEAAEFAETFRDWVRWPLANAVGRFVGEPLRWLHSQAAVWLVVHAGGSDETGRDPALASSFARAVRRFRNRFRDRPRLTHLAFKLWFEPAPLVSDGGPPLPLFFAPDVCLWGMANAAADGRYWLDLHQKAPSRSDGSAATRDPEEHPPAPPDLFPSAPTFRGGTVTVAPNDPTEVYAALLLASLRVLENRAANRPAEGPVFDALAIAPYERRALVVELIQHVFAELPEAPAPAGSARAAVVDITGQWVGAALDRFGSAPDEYELRTLRAVARRCARLQPEQPEHFYRIGAVECLLGDARAALEAFARAGELDARPIGNGATYIGAHAIVELDVGECDPRHMARVAALVARALNTGDPWVCRRLGAKLGLRPAGTNTKASDDDPPASLRTLDQLNAYRLAGGGAVSREYTILQIVREFAERAARPHLEPIARSRWEQAGRPDGRSTEFWLEAKRQFYS